jgi:type II secretory pathway pseudopilin PulG
MKTIIGLAIGIVLAAAVVIPLANARTEAELEAQRTQIKLEQAQEELKSLKDEQKAAVTAEVTPKPQGVKTEPEVVTPAVTEVEAPTEIKTEPANEPVSEPTASPQVKQSANTYPKEFFENGKKYAYLTEYAESVGQKTEIVDYAEGESNAVQEDFLDWENEPHIPGPFNGNGASGNNN